MADAGTETGSGFVDQISWAGQLYSDRNELVVPFAALAVAAVFLEWGLELLSLLFEVEWGPRIVVDPDIRREAITGPLPELLVPLLEEFVWLFVLGVAGTGLVTLVVSLTATGTAFLTARDDLEGAHRSQGDTVAVVLSRLSTLLVAAVLYSSAVGVGLLLLVVPGLYLAVRLSLTFPAIVIDDLGPVEGLRAAWNRSADRLLEVGGVVLSAAVLGVLVNLLPYIGVLITTLLVLPVFSLALARCYLTSG